MEPCDLLISAAVVLPVAPQNHALPNHAVAIKDGVILALGETNDLRARYTPTEHLDLDEHILLPGLVNAHGHAAMTLLRGAGEDQSLQAWLEQTIWPLEARLADAEFVALGTEVAIAEMLRSGTTTFSDMYYFPEVVAQTASRAGMRAQIASPVIDIANAWSESLDDALHKGLALYDEYRHHPHIHMALGPHAAYTVPRAGLERVLMYANELDAAVQIHLHENQAEVSAALAEHGQTWIQILHDVGLLGPHLQAVHMTCVSDEDAALIADTQTHVIHCPTSNLKLASGYCDLHRFSEMGINVALGTDGAASNNTLSLFEEMHLASILAKHTHQDPTVGNAATLLEHATLDGARALGLAEQTGSLEPGKDADLIAIKRSDITMQPSWDPYAALLHGNAGNNVDHVFVRGRHCLAAGSLTTVNEAELLNKLKIWSDTHCP